jgi:DNA-binding transcriptional LysR family regulator
MLNLNQLRAFYQTAKHLSFTAAAKALCITQPAVTAQVKLFEEYLDLKLFKKKGGKLFLTEEGNILYEYALKIFEHEKEMEAAVQEMKKLDRGILRLGTARTYARYFVPLLISRFREAHPGITIHLDEGSSSDMTRRLMDLKNEIAIVAKTEETPDVRFVPFSQEELVLIVTPDHYLAQKQAISLEELKEEPIIMKETGSGTRRMVEGLFVEHKLTPKILMETSDAEMIKLLVQHGEGISFLVREAVARELKEGRLATVPIGGTRVYLDISIAYLKNQPLSPPAKAFLNSLEDLGTEEMRFQGMGALMKELLGRQG